MSHEVIYAPTLSGLSNLDSPGCGMDIDSTQTNVKQRLMIAIAVWFTMIPFMGGCDSVNQGLSDFANSVSPKRLDKLRKWLWIRTIRTRDARESC